MRIVHAVGGLANMSGTTRIILRLSEQMVGLGHDVTIIHLTGRGFDALRPCDKRIRVVECPVRLSRRWGYAPGLRTMLRKIAESTDIFHVHSNWLYLNYAVWREAGRLNVPYIVAPQGALDQWSLRYHGWRKRIYALLLERRIMNDAAVIQAVSEKEARSISAFGVRAPVKVISNGADIAGFTNPPDRLQVRQLHGIGENDIVGLYLGRLVEKKGCDILIRAHAVARRRDARHRLIIAGGDFGSGYRAHLESEAGKEMSVEFVGEADDARKKELFAASDYFVLLSHSEGQPVAVLEAMAAGLPVIVTPACGLSDVVAAGAGFEVEADESSATRAILKMGEKGVTAEMGAKSQLLAANRFDWSIVAGRILQMYESARCGRMEEQVGRG